MKITSNSRRSSNVEDRRGDPPTRHENLYLPDISDVETLGDDNYSFTYKYHLDTIKKKLARSEPDGKITTVRTIGVPYKGRIYNIPSYDRDTGRIMSNEEALKKFLPYIKKGAVDSFPEKWDGPIEEHPANVAARIEHQILESSDKYIKSINPEYQWWKRDDE